MKAEEKKRDLELELLEAKIELAVLEYENYKWLHKKQAELKENLGWVELFYQN
jgi:hypothetical protein